MISLPRHLSDSMDLTSNDQDEYPKMRTFYLVDGKVLFGVLLLETHDSFLVGAAVRLVRKDNYSEVEAEPMYDSMVIRIMKSSTAMVTLVSRKFLFVYLDYLYTEGSKILPEYITEERLDSIKSTMDVITEASLPASVTEPNFSGNVIPPQLTHYPAEKVMLH